MKLGLKGKLMGIFGVILLLLVGISYFAVQELQTINNLYSQMFTERMVKVANTLNAQKESLKMAYAARGYVLYVKDEYIDQFENGHREFINQVNTFRDTVRTEEGKKLLSNMMEKEKTYYGITSDLLLFKKGGGAEKEVQAKLTEAAKASGPLTEAVESFSAFQQKRLFEDKELLSSRAHKGILILVLSALASVIIGSGLSLYYAGRLTRPILAVGDQASRVAAGDLSVEELNIRTGDEMETMSNSFNSMVSYLKEMVVKLNENASQLVMAAEQISVGTEETAAASQSQAAQTEKVNSNLQDAAAVMEQISASTQEMAAGAEKTTSIAKEGEEVMSESISGINLINNKITLLYESSKKIESILKAISEIADQTNLLSLNAAIEAARAGEQGKGFAVVAEEVRKLAERSAQSAKDSALLIKDVENEVNNTVAAVKSGVELTDKAAKSFVNIKNLVLDISKGIAEISDGIQHQAVSSSELVGASHELNSLISTNASIAQETAAQTAALAQIAESLQGLVKRFKL